MSNAVIEGEGSHGKHSTRACAASDHESALEAKASHRAGDHRGARGARRVHSTVQTLLRKLEAKGAVGHEVNDRTFIFFPLVTETDAARFALRDVIGRVFNGSPSGMVAYLVKHEKLTRKELDEIKKVIEETNP